MLALIISVCIITYSCWSFKVEKSRRFQQHLSTFRWASPDSHSKPSMRRCRSHVAGLSAGAPKHLEVRWWWRIGPSHKPISQLPRSGDRCASAEGRSGPNGPIEPFFKPTSIGAILGDILRPFRWAFLGFRCRRASLGASQGYPPRLQFRRRHHSSALPTAGIAVPQHRAWHGDLKMGRLWFMVGSISSKNWALALMPLRHFKTFPSHSETLLSSCHTSTEGVDEVGVEEPCESVPWFPSRCSIRHA